LTLKLYSKIKNNYNEGGISNVLRAGIRKVSYTFYHTNNAFWFRMDLRDKIKDIDHDGNISLNIDDRDNSIEYIKNYGHYYPEEINVGLYANHLYSNIMYNNKIIGYNKTGFSDLYIQDFKQIYKFNKNIAFTYDTFIDTAYRNRNYGSCLLRSVCNYLKQKGFKSIWAHIPPWNKASEAMHKKIGFKKYTTISYYSVAGVSWMSKDPLKYIQYIENQISHNVKNM